MDRDALFVDVGMWGGKGGDDDDTAAAAEKTIRLCNTHLESLALDPPFRPPQVAVFASYMRGGSSEAGAAAAATPHGAVAAGDFNAIQDFDRTLHADNGLRDAFLELGGREDDPASYTWGQQAATELRERFGCSRSTWLLFFLLLPPQSYCSLLRLFHLSYSSFAFSFIPLLPTPFS